MRKVGSRKMHEKIVDTLNTPRNFSFSITGMCEKPLLSMLSIKFKTREESLAQRMLLPFVAKSSASGGRQT